MIVLVLDALAQAIYAYEGNKPGDRAFRNNNPGNLRTTTLIEAQDGDHYRIFPTFRSGYQALLDDLTAKITGKNDHGLSQESTLVAFFQVYAPAGDDNAPAKYAAFVADWMSRTYEQTVTPTLTIRRLYKQVAKEAVPLGVTAA